MDFEEEKLKIENAELKARLAEANKQIGKMAEKHQTIEQELDLRVAQGIIELAAEEEAQKQELARDAERQKASQVLKRPTTLAEWKSFSVLEKSRCIDLYAGGDSESFVANLVAQDRRTAQAAANSAILTKIQSSQARFKG